MRNSVAAGRVLSILFSVAALPALAQSPFDAVFAIMTQDAGPDSPGCRGCHVGPQESPPAPWWGDTQEDVLASIEASGLVVGGRMSYFGYRLQQGEMPLGGRPWSSDEIDILNSWLITYETPADPFDAVFAIMTQDAGPGSPGCRGCHIGPQESPPAPWWGDTQQDVRASIEASGLVVGGRMSYLAFRLEGGGMPLGGRQWSGDEISILNNWLITYETSGEAN